MTKCLCPDWDEQSKRINDPITFMQITGRVKYDEKHFKAWVFCPWCGAKTFQVKHEDDATGTS